MSAPWLAGVHGSSVCGDIMYLIFLVISKDHLLEGSFEFIGGSSFQYITNVTSLVTIDIMIGEI